MTRTQVALCCLLAAQLAYLLFGGSDRAAYRPRRAHTEGRLFPALRPDAVAELEIERGGRRTLLRRRGERFVVVSEGEAPADDVAVESALQALADLEDAVVVSENPAKFRDFGVEGPDAITVRARDGRGVQLAELVVGEATSDWRSTYLRVPPDAPEVWLVDGALRSAFDREGGRPGAWRDRTVTDADPLALRSIEIFGPEETIVLERRVPESTERGAEGAEAPSAQDRWRMVRPREGWLGRYQGSAMAETLARLEADGVVVDARPPAQLGFEPPAVRVVGHLADGSDVVLEIGAQEGRDRYVRVPDRPDVFRVGEYRLLAFLRSSDELLEPGSKEKEEDGGKRREDSENGERKGG